jgi:hypothetical protein
MGKPFVPSRKKCTEKSSRVKRLLGKASKRRYMNDKNKFNTFGQFVDMRRSNILQNFKQIQRIITKNYIKKKDPYNNTDVTESDYQDEEKEKEELENIKKMKVILRELSVAQTAPKAKAYPTFKYIHTKSSSTAPRSSFSMA